MNQRPKIKKFVILLNGKNKNSNIQVISHNLKSTKFENINNEMIYVADGALKHFTKIKKNVKNIIWAGDQDSLTKTSKKYLDKYSISNKNRTSQDFYIKDILLEKNKNFSDFSVLLDMIFSNNSNSSIFIEVFFGLGGRRDHEMANILEAERFISKLPFGGICYFHGGIIISSVEFEIKKANKMNFSIFSKSNNSELEISDAIYSGHFSLERPSHGLSNQACGNTISVKPKSSIISFYF
jgi:thiamine pyrophosphokinase